MEKVKLTAEIREEKGKTRVKALRKTEFVPGVVYKDGKEAVSIKMMKRGLHDTLHTAAGENVLINLSVEGKKPRTCIIKEIQRDPLKDEIIHVDLNEISLTEKLKVKVPVVSHGEAEGAVKDGGVLEHVIWEVEVECLPTDIPEKIEVEVGPMKIGDTVYIKDLKVPASVKILNDPELTVFSVTPPAKEEAPVAEELPEGAEEPEVIGKGKKEEEEIPEGEAEAKPKAKEEKPKEEKPKEEKKKE